MNHRSQLIVKNTIFLYVRLFFVMAVSLYTSRVLLQMLGVYDFGIYSIVGSITAIFASLKSLFAEATQRYLNNAKGKGDKELVKRVFSTSLYLHVIVGLIFVIIVLIAGIAFLKTTVKIPEGRETAALNALYFSILSIFIIILTIPYDAVIMANEKFSAYSIFSIVDATLKLSIVLIVPLFGQDNLVLYTKLLCLVSLFTLSAYFFYSHRFDECRTVRIYDKSLIKELGFFSLWNAVGNFIFSLVHEIYNLLLNIYGGVISNAARNIAYQVKSAIGTVTNNTLIAVKPFVMQEVVNKDRIIISNHICKISAFTFYMSMTTALPIIIFAHEILELWLVEVPPGSVTFTQLVVFSVLIRSLHGPLSLLFVSYAKIKVSTIGEGILYLASILVVYIMLEYGLPLWSMFAFLCFIEVVCIIILNFIAKRVIDFDSSSYMCLLFKLFSLTLVALSLTYCVKCGMSELIKSAWWYIVMLIISIGIILMTTYLFMSKDERKLLHGIVHLFIKR